MAVLKGAVCFGHPVNALAAKLTGEIGRELQVLFLIRFFAETTAVN